jgi:bifunctional non-homologous end joining protein LigD
VSRSPFIPPAQPVLRERPPKGDRWLHEVKFDGYRVQLHKTGREVTIYSRNGADFTNRFPSLAYILRYLPVKALIIDAEVIDANARGMPNFFALHARRCKPEDVCCYAFDLLNYNGRDLRPLPLIIRRSRLEKVIARITTGCIFFSQSFADAEKLLAECEKRGLEGIISKRKDAPYGSGEGDWIKVTKASREAYKDRSLLLNP